MKTNVLSIGIVTCLLTLALIAWMLRSPAAATWKAEEPRDANSADQQRSTAEANQSSEDASANRSVVPTQSTAATTSGSPSAYETIPDWAEPIVKECGIDKEQALRALANPAAVSDIRSAWDDTSAPVSEAVTKRSMATGKIARDRQESGHYEVYSPDQRLPDADLSRGEFLTYGYEKNPQGGRDLVRLIRILPGDDPKFDEARQEEADARRLRRDAIRRLFEAYRK